MKSSAPAKASQTAEAEEKIIKTFCGDCGPSCGVLVHVKDGKVVKIEGDPENVQGTEGMACPRATSYLQLIYHPDRLKYPMKCVGERGKGKWQRVSWDEALDTIAKKFTEIREKYGPESFAVSVGGSTRRNVPATRILADSLGTPNWAYTDVMFCVGPDVIASTLTYGRRVSGELNSEAEHSKCAILWGGNPATTYLTWQRRVLKAKLKGGKLIVIDPRFTETASQADVWLQVRPGTDGALALGMLNVIINEGLYDKEFVNKWCVGFEELKKRVQEYPLEKVAEITWVPAKDIEKVARMYATTKPATIFSMVANEQSSNSTQTCRAVDILRAITGNLDIKGGNVFPCVPPGFAVFGSMWFSDKKWRPPEELEEKRIGAKEFPLLCGPRSPIGGFHWPTLCKTILSEKPYPIKAMFVVNNLLTAMPNSREVYRALMKLDFLVVSELFMTPTAEVADIVLPAASWLEIEGLLDRSLTTLVARRKAIEPIAECWDELKITGEILKRMGLKFSIWPELNSWEEYEDFRLKPAGITFADLKEKGPISSTMEYKKYEKDGFKTPSGKVELYSSVFEELGYDPLPHHAEPMESPYSTPELAKEYPLILITGGRDVGYRHSMGRQIPWLRELVPDPLIQIHPETAKKLGIEESDWVWIETPRGEGRVKQKAKLTVGIHPQVVHTPAHWWFPEKPAPDHGVWDSNINVAISGDPPYEEITGSVPVKALLCKIYKVTEE